MDVTQRTRNTAALVLALLLAVGLLASCDGGGSDNDDPPPPRAAPTATQTPEPAPPEPPPSVITLGFAGDIHFERHVAQWLERVDARRPLGPVTELLRAPDLMMVNLETAIATGGQPEPKQYTFRTSPAALDLLAASGVDVVTMANNHGADYGRSGLRETLAAIDGGPLPVVGIGPDIEAAFAPYRAEIAGTSISVFGVSSRPEHTAKRFAATETTAGIAVAIEPHRRLLSAVRRADEAGDLVVVYLHWGQQHRTCADPRQQRMARALSRAGADVVVGSHAHVLQGAGWLGSTYVAYGLADFIWYHNYRPDTGVLTLRVRDGEVVRHRFHPTLIQSSGVPLPRQGQDRVDALRAWDALRGCSGLTPFPSTP
ncbi:CapA family protein [Nocardioides caldifontis]|uniref:CapA family protein n=1 Tax=Nocardioides caldifontis TaxID=2588938 RepID=UPI0011E033E6|nr:CapA family protein [Nocardioides caldifontis]